MTSRRFDTTAHGSLASAAMVEPILQMPRTGWIEVIVGSMYSGKTEELIRRLRRAQIARQRVEIFKPGIDDRYAPDAIVSHSELRIPSRAVKHARDILLEHEAERLQALGRCTHLLDIRCSRRVALCNR